MKWTAILTGAAALCLGATALAYDPPHGGRGMGRMLAFADANSDGSITVAEARAAREQMFTHMDANSDGYLSEADREARQAARQSRHGRGMANLDADNDGRVSRAEFLSGDGEWFTRADTNHNNVVEPAEIEAVRAAMAERRAHRQSNQ